MRIGLDLALFSANRSVDRVALITKDTDCVAALKHARRAGLKVVLICLPNAKIASELPAHVDYQLRIAWPVP